MYFYRPVRYIKKKYWPGCYKAVIKYIKNKYTEKLYLDDIARISGFSRYYFCQVFKILTEKTVIGYINTVRVEKAKELLKNSDLKIMKISFAVGFPRISSFNKNFKKIVGITPREYGQNEQNRKIV